MALYENGILVSGANTLPKMTLAEYQALPVSERPTYWERTDGSYSDLFAEVTLDVNETIQDGAANSKTFVMGTVPTGYKGISAYFERTPGQGGNTFEMFPYIDNGNVRINVQNLTGSALAIVGTLHFVFAKF